MKHRNLNLLLLCATIGTLSAGWAIANKTGIAAAAAVQPSRPAPLVYAQGVEPQDGYYYSRTFTGRVEAARSSALGFELEGRLAQIVVREGDRVQAGQVLAQLDTARLDAQRKELLAAETEAEASLALARATLNRYDEIVERGSVSRQDHDEARKAFQATQARVRLTRRQVDSVDVELAKTRLRAPYPGIVVARRADEGRVLDAGVDILELQEVATPEIRVGVAGRLVDNLRVGIRYELLAGEQRFSGRLRSVLPLRSLTGRTVDAIFEPEDLPARLRPGDLVRLTLNEFIAASGSWLPISALTEAQRGLWSVYVTLPGDGGAPTGIDATHRLRRRLVNVVYHDAQRVYVSGSLTSNDRIVVDGVHRVVPGQWVRETAAPASVALVGPGVRGDG